MQCVRVCVCVRSRARYLHPFPKVWRMSVKRTESIATVAHRTHYRQQRYWLISAYID